MSGAASDSLNQRAALLVPAVRTGNPEALGALYDLTARRLHLVAQRAMANDADAEDVVHDLFVGLPEALRHYRESGRVMSWLVTCTMRLALMRRRAGARRRESAWEEAAEHVAGAAAVDRPDLAPEVDEAYRRIAALPEALRDVVLLRSEGLTHAEIAQALGISEGNSRIRLARALERLLPQSAGTPVARVHTEDRLHD